MGGTVPAQSDAKAPPGKTTVVEARAVIHPNNPDSYKLGPVKAGDVITLQYISGSWKDHGRVPSDNPDSAKIEKLNGSRLVLAGPSRGGKPGELIAVVPHGTAQNPFVYTVQTPRDQVVLRIHLNSDNQANPGSVVYQVKITR
jgi:hypothetical protein